MLGPSVCASLPGMHPHPAAEHLYSVSLQSKPSGADEFGSDREGQHTLWRGKTSVRNLSIESTWARRWCQHCIIPPETSVAHLWKPDLRLGLILWHEKLAKMGLFKLWGGLDGGSFRSQTLFFQVACHQHDKPEPKIMVLVCHAEWMFYATSRMFFVQCKIHLLSINNLCL